MCIRDRDIRDESNREGIRVAIDLKKNIEPETVKRQLYKYTSLESSFSFNTLAIVDRKPKNCNLKDFLENLSNDILVFLDQAYFEYIESTEFDIPFSLIKDHPNLVISRSFSKAHGLAALRLGFCVSNPDLSDYLNRVRQPFNANSLALDLGKIALTDQEHISKSVKINSSGMERVKNAFIKFDYNFIESWGNFISFDAKQDSDTAFQYFLKKGVILRSLKVYEMPNHLRVSIGTENEMQQFFSTLEDYAKFLSK